MSIPVAGDPGDRHGRGTERPHREERAILDQFVRSVLVVPALIAVVALPVIDRMPPGRAAVVLAWSAVGVAPAEAVILGLVAAEAMAQVSAGGRLFGWSASVVLLVSGTSADAYSIEGPPGRIIVTTGMRESLTDRQYAVLLMSVV